MLVGQLILGERSGYFEEWTAGYGLREIAQFLMQFPKNELVVVGTEGIFGTLPDGIEIYFADRPNVIFQGGKATISAELKTAAKAHPTFFIKNTGRLDIIFNNIELLQEYPKASKPDGTHESIYLYKVYPDISTPSAKSR